MCVCVWSLTILSGVCFQQNSGTFHENLIVLDWFFFHLVQMRPGHISNITEYFVFLKQDMYLVQYLKYSIRKSGSLNCSLNHSLIWSEKSSLHIPILPWYERHSCPWGIDNMVKKELDHLFSSVGRNALIQWNVLSCSLVSFSLKVAITKYLKLDGLNKRNLFFRSSEG